MCSAIVWKMNVIKNKQLVENKLSKCKGLNSS